MLALASRRLKDGSFNIKQSGDRALFTLTSLPDNRLQPGEYLMATTRTHDQFNTTIYGLDDRYRGIYNERRVVLMNATDMQEQGFEAGEKVDLFNYDDGVERIAPLFLVVPYAIPKRNAVTYFPETNVLVSVNNTVEESHMPASKYIKIQIRKHNPVLLKQSK